MSDRTMMLVQAVFLSLLAVPSQVYANRSLRFEYEFRTETEEEQVSVKEIIRSSDTPMGAHELAFGSFQAQVRTDYASKACAKLVDQFAVKTDCSCSMSKHYDKMAVNYGCQTLRTNCRSDVCAKHQYTGTVNTKSSLGVYEFCVTSLTVGRTKLGKLCIALQLDKRNHISSCIARMGRRQCQCTMCGEDSIQLDCSTHHSKAVSTTCDKIELISSIHGDKDTLVEGYLPSFDL